MKGIMLNIAICGINEYILKDVRDEINPKKLKL